jgi:molybdate transport system substrate-binding protein
MKHFACAVGFVLALGVCCAWPPLAVAGEATIAVAANFVGTLKKLQTNFEALGEHKLNVISGSTGKFTAQIIEGAPLDVFLSADNRATKKLAEAGMSVADTEFTYAVGILALFSADPQRIADNGEAILRAGKFSKLAIANPKVAPYGVAAEQTMTSLGIADVVRNKIVMGDNIAQAFQLIDTGNADLGFVALSQVLESDSGRKGSYWKVPAELHEPIQQNAVLLKRAQDNAAAKQFLGYLKSPQAKQAIADAGYVIIGE